MEQVVVTNVDVDDNDIIRLMVEAAGIKKKLIKGGISQEKRKRCERRLREIEIIMWRYYLWA